MGYTEKRDSCLGGSKEVGSVTVADSGEVVFEADFRP